MNKMLIFKIILIPLCLISEVQILYCRLTNKEFDGVLFMLRSFTIDPSMTVGELKLFFVFDPTTTRVVVKNSDLMAYIDNIVADTEYGLPTITIKNLRWSKL